jgi:hypothetical protein
MLISLTKKFVFIANLKTASTAIEHVLRSYAQLRLLESRFGKHQTFRQIESRFGWMLEQIAPNELFVFGVIREPVDYMLSLYNSHMDPKFKQSAALYTGDLDFDQFLNEWTQRNAEQVKQQHLRFLDRSGRIAANYIISYQKLAEGLKFVGDRLAIPDLASIPTENPSYGRFQISSITGTQREHIDARFAQDVAFLHCYCDRSLNSRLQFGGKNAFVAGAVARMDPALPNQVAAAHSAFESDNQTDPEELLATQIVRALYRTFLLREPDPSGFDNLVEQIRRRQPIEEILHKILESPEFSSKHERFLQTCVRANVGQTELGPT